MITSEKNLMITVHDAVYKNYPLRVLGDMYKKSFFMLSDFTNNSKELFKK